MFVHFVDELGAVIYHFVHGVIHGESSFFEAEHAVIIVFAAVSVRADKVVCERHAAALTKLLIRIHLIKY